MSDISDDLIDLQERLAYQEDTIAQLNAVVTQQHADIMQLQQQMRILAKKFEDLVYSQGAEPLGDANERPPHY